MELNIGRFVSGIAHGRGGADFGTIVARARRDTVALAQDADDRVRWDAFMARMKDAIREARAKDAAPGSGPLI
jgi:hypothetical protein